MGSLSRDKHQAPAAAAAAGADADDQALTGTERRNALLRRARMLMREARLLLEEADAIAGHSDGTAVAPLRAIKGTRPFRLLVELARAGDRSIRVEALAKAIAPDRAFDEKLRRLVYVYIHHLRVALREAGVAGAIVWSTGGYRIRSQDVESIRALCESAQSG